MAGHKKTLRLAEGDGRTHDSRGVYAYVIISMRIALFRFVMPASMQDPTLSVNSPHRAASFTQLVVAAHDVMSPTADAINSAYTR
ncbi:hypothetical protein BMS3Bbin02_02300 [bacterium BMS3Bbin02]|nr:hypothetical protein BMS3Bbin02_02300 [bacterium BMS3Bbin02]